MDVIPAMDNIHLSHLSRPQLVNLLLRIVDLLAQPLPQTEQPLHQGQVMHAPPRLEPHDASIDPWNEPELSQPATATNPEVRCPRPMHGSTYGGALNPGATAFYPMVPGTTCSEIWWYLVTTTSMISAVYTQAFLDAFASLEIEPWAGIEMDVAWGQTTLRFGLHRPSVTGPIFVYRVCTALRQDTPTRMQVLSHADLSPDQLLSAIAGQHPDLRDTWADGGWQLCAIDATRGHSRDRSLMHPCYILIQVDDYWVFNHRPHGLLELVLGSLDLSFPCVLPQMINFPVLQAFLSPLLPQGLSCLSLQMWHNGAAVDYQLVSCFNGFFIQIIVEVNNILMENIRLAAPLIIPHLHIDQMVLTDPQLLQVTAFVPGGDTLISSRSLTMTEKRNRVFTILDSVLRQRFADMRNVGFLLLTAHPSSKWMDPAFSPQKEKVVVVYSDDVLQGSASVLLRLSLPPHDAEGAIYVRRRLRLRYLIRQLGISLLCGDAGAECLCYVNGMELSNDREMAVDDAAFIHCWGLPAADSEEADLITIGDSISQHSVDVHMPVSEFALTSPCDH